MKKVLENFSKGEFIIVFDEHREQEADLFILAEFVTPEAINFLLRKACGMICVACEASILERLKIPLITDQNTSIHQTNFCIPVDGGEGTTTGVSASDRARVIKLLSEENSLPSDFLRPGHTFPLRAERDFSRRFGHTEAAVFLAQECERVPVVVICEILNEVGEKASFQEVEMMADEFGVSVVTLEEIMELSRTK